MKLVKETNHWFLIELQCIEKQESIFVCNVYGPLHYRDKMVFWETINLLSENLQGKDVILEGDFNASKSKVEKRGCSIIRNPFGEKIEDLMVDLDLLDPPLKNGKYTWSNKRTGP